MKKGISLLLVLVMLLTLCACGSNGGETENTQPKECTHEYAESVTKEATCTEEGQKSFTCSKCGDSYTEEISATGHSYAEDTCTVCGFVDESYVGYLDSSWAIFTVGDDGDTIQVMNLNFRENNNFYCRHLSAGDEEEEFWYVSCEFEGKTYYSCTISLLITGMTIAEEIDGVLYVAIVGGEANEDDEFTEDSPLCIRFEAERVAGDRFVVTKITELDSQWAHAEDVTVGTILYAFDGFVYNEDEE